MRRPAEGEEGTAGGIEGLTHRTGQESAVRSSTRTAQADLEKWSKRSCRRAVRGLGEQTLARFGRRGGGGETVVHVCLL